MLKDLRKLYQEKLRFLGANNADVNVTRLKEEILKQIPGLCEKKSGKYVLLTVTEVGRALFESSQSSSIDEGIILSKAAKIVRKYMFLREETFSGDLSKQRQRLSVPDSLYHLIALILEENVDVSNLKSITLNIAQLIRFNAVKSKRSATGSIRHSKTNEPPFPVKIGLLVHAKTRKKSIVEKLAEEWLSISYNRVKDIQETITKQLCKKYNEEEIFCPPLLKPHLFTTAAIDNIDHNPSSTTAKSSFHGTSISLFQHEVSNNISETFKLDTDTALSSIEVKLPDQYTDILPTRSGKPEYPAKPPLLNGTFPSTSLILNDASEWLKIFKEMNDEVDSKHESFAAFYSETSQSTDNKDTSTLLPLLLESVNSPSVVRHCMGIIKTLVANLNPGQSTIITGDQPVYAIGKQVQWMHPDEYENCLWMMGPLHIEMAYVSAIGDWLDGSSWIEVFQRANINTPGRIESFLNGANVKRSRYAHQVSLASLITLSRKAFESQSEILNYDDWKNGQRNKSINADY